MKRLLLIFSLMIPAWLYSCTGTKPPVPTPSQVIEEAHSAIKDIPITKVPAEEFDGGEPAPLPAPFVKPKVKHAPVGAPVRTRVRPVVRPVPRPRPPAAEAPMETLPPQEVPSGSEAGTCIFPFNMIPTCTPEPSGRMP